MGWINSQGYNMIYKNGKEIREHRLIAEEALGVPIPEDILVHHISIDKEKLLKIAEEINSGRFS